MKELLVGLIASAIGCVVVCPAADAAQENVLYSFCSQTNCTDGLAPLNGVIDVDGTLYGTTYDNGGTVFSLDLKTGAEKTIHSFGNGTDGSFPEGGLIEVGGKIYGTTADGGAGSCSINGTHEGCGTVYSVNPKTGAETVVYSFQDNNADGISPEARLFEYNGMLYGTTYFGGAGNGCNSVYYGCGTVFSLDPTTGSERVVYSFQGNGTDGNSPEAGLIESNGALYGTTSYGGSESCGCGTVFSLDLKTGVETVLHSFAGAPDGEIPFAALIQVNDELYGTTEYGGANCPDTAIPGCGTIFSLNLNSGAEAVAYSFCGEANCADGNGPTADLTRVKGKLYGTTAEGGKNVLQGAVFSLDLKSGAERVLYSFDGRHGRTPSSNLIDVDGMLYGTTYKGGKKSKNCKELGGHLGCGTVFSIVP